MKIEEQLPGRWVIKATNFPLWLSDKRHQPTITYGLVANNPLTFSDLVDYRTNKDKVKSIVGIDTATTTGFEWRGNGILKLLSSRWEIVYLDECLLIIRFEKSLLTPAGVDVLLRECSEIENLNDIIKGALETYQLTEAEFQSLSWLLI